MLENPYQILFRTSWDFFRNQPQIMNGQYDDIDSRYNPQKSCYPFSISSHHDLQIDPFVMIVRMPCLHRAGGV
jgi:hypothetical protein